MLVPGGDNELLISSNDAEAKPRVSESRGELDATRSPGRPGRVTVISCGATTQCLTLHLPVGAEVPEQVNDAGCDRVESFNEFLRRRRRTER